MPPDLHGLVGIRDWLTDSLLAYLAWVEHHEVELPSYFPQRLLKRPGGVQSIWQRLRVRSHHVDFQPDPDDDPYAFRRRQSRGESEEPSVVTWDDETAERFRRAVVLGDPGAGKTWLLRTIARRLAADALRDLEERRTVTANQVQCPVLVRLPELARASNEPLESALASFVCEKAALGVEWLRQRRLASTAGNISSRNGAAAVGTSPHLNAFVMDGLRSGRFVVLLDAWDEVPRGSRARIAERVRRFAEACPSARIVITSRDIAGVDGALLKSSVPPGDRPAELELLALESEQVMAFVTAWFGHAASGALGRAADALRKVLRDHPPMAALGCNPLMLTFMCRLAEKGRDEAASIPKSRVELYDGVLTGLLRDWWEEDRKSHAVSRPPIASLSAHLELLAPVAHALVDAGRLGEVSESDLRDVVRLHHAALLEREPQHELRHEDATTLLAMWKAAGLIVPAGGGEVLFLHRTFQEYLAGLALVPAELVALATPRAARAAAAVECASRIAYRLRGSRRRRADWQEPIRLALGYIGVVKRRPEECAAVIRDVIERAPGEAGAAVAAMGEAVAEFAPASAVAGGIPAPFRKALVRTVQAAMRDEPLPAVPASSSGVLSWRSTRRAKHAVKAATRVACGNALARLGDPRFHGAELACLPNDVACGFASTAATDLLGFVLVNPPQGGSFYMGVDDKDAFGPERPLHAVSLSEPYYLGRWPLTVAQFARFVEATGYDAGRGWAMVETSGDHRWWGRLPDSFARDPYDSVVNVSWTSAIAYCDWLTMHLRTQDNLDRVPFALRECLRSTWRVSLPTEAQWEWAARGPARHVHPGGHHLTPFCQSRATKRVGCFSDGASWCRVEVVAGEVGEWTRSKWESYPYVSTDGREDLVAQGPRVVRSGRGPLFGRHRASRDDSPNLFYRCISRDRIGFRLALVPSRS